MHKFQTTPKPSSVNQSKYNRSEQSNQLFFQLKELHQIQDESRNQLSPVFMDQQSMIRQRKESRWTNNQYNQTNLLKQYEETQEQSYKNHYQPFNKQKRSYYDVQTDINLKDSNRKLLQDNKKLFNQCFRLRKICEKYEKNSKSDVLNEKRQNDKLLENEKRNLIKKNTQLLQQNQQLKKNCSNLQEKIRKLGEQIQNIQFMNYRCDKMSSELSTLQKVNDDLKTKVNDLQKELQETISRKTSRSNQSASINNSTQQSRKSEVEMDRKITNIKLVYDNEIKKLKNVIGQLKKQVSSKGSSQSSFSSAVNY